MAESQDVRDVVFAEIQAAPGITSRKISELHPEIGYKRITKILGKMRRKTKEIEAVEIVAGGKFADIRYYPKLEARR